MSRAVNAIVIGIAAMIVIVGVFWFFVDFLGAQVRDAQASEDHAPVETQETEVTEETEEEPTPTPETHTTTFVTTSATTGTASETFTSTATITQTQTQTFTPSPSTTATRSNDTDEQEPSFSMRQGVVPAAAALAPPSVLADIDAGNVVRDLMEQASLALILGGLLMLGFVVALVMIRAMFSSGSDVGPRFKRPEPLTRGTRVTPELGATDLPPGPPQHPPNTNARRDGREEGRRSRIKAFPDVAAAMIGQGVGDVRLLHIRDREASIRVYRCRECAAGRQAHIQGCSYTVGWLEGAVATLEREPRVRETACTIRGGTVCEFEVRF